MKLTKKTVIILLLMITMLIFAFSSCATNPAVANDTQMQPTGTAPPTATSVPVATISTMTPSPIITPSQSPTTPSPAQDVQNGEMNLEQIQAGDYSSLLGTWTEVDYSINAFDGNGEQWYAGTPDAVHAILSVSTEKIVLNDLVFIQGNTLTDDTGSQLLLFKNNSSSLAAETADTNAVTYWYISFYPKGVANDLQPNNGVKIDITKNIIAIWYSEMKCTIVFAQN